MTRKLAVVFALSLCLCFPILLAFVGKDGYLHNQALRREIASLRYEDEVLSLQVQSLQQQRNQMNSDDALRDAAFKYGYQSEGEQVYYFDEKHLEPPLRGITSPVVGHAPIFPGFSWPYVLLTALGISSLFTVSYGIFAYRWRKKHGR
ncbi:MAG: septum formation initiator family protein [Sphaerochaeta sp.]|jgi:cell division protein FtsB|uniref:septum formation initiator family protein n=1 Tax=Sphaerochaeta sp. TaxID=1972642 RepID=UPI002FCB20B9